MTHATRLQWQHILGRRNMEQSTKALEAKAKVPRDHGAWDCGEAVEQKDDATTNGARGRATQAVTPRTPGRVEWASVRAATVLLQRSAGPQVAGRTTEPPGREILRGELWGHVWWAARTGGRGQCLGVGGTPQRPCPAVLCGSLDRWYRVTGAPFRAGKWVADKVEALSRSVLCVPGVLRSTGTWTLASRSSPGWNVRWVE